MHTVIETCGECGSDNVHDAYIEWPTFNGVYCDDCNTFTNDWPLWKIAAFYACIYTVWLFRNPGMYVAE